MLRLLLASLLALVVWSGSLGTASIGRSWAAAPLLHLHTEYLPYRHRVDKGLQYRLMREMPRQAMLIAARDELGIATRDGTLGEIPKRKGKEPALHAVLAERTALDKTWRVRMYSYDASNKQSDPRDLWPNEPAWEKTFAWGNTGSKVYGEMNPVFEKASREEFVEALQQLGLEKQPTPEGPAPEYDQAAMEATLLKADFIAMYGVLRATHEQIRYTGQTPELLSILARGYANLSMLTQHQWNAVSEAFAARAMLYAQRLVVADNESPFSLWTRAYVWAVIGCHQHSLADLEKLADAEPPAWGKLVSPFVHFDREGLQTIAGEDEALATWALRLDFQLASAYRYPQWIYEAAVRMGKNSPMDYGVYAEMAHSTISLGVTRTGARYGPLAFARFSTPSLNALPGLPDSILALLPTDAVKAAAIRALITDPNPRDGFSPVPNFIARKLRQLPPDSESAGISWSALAYLLEEETFVQAANFLAVASVGTEVSQDDQVASVLPLVKDHRYAPYIQSFRLSKQRDAAAWQKLLSEIEINDFRGNMSSLTYALWGVRDARGQNLGQVARSAGQRNFTMQGVIEEQFTSYYDWRPNDLGHARMLAQEFARISPHCEVAIRMTIIANPKADLEQLKKWEAELSQDPVGFRELGGYYQLLGDTNSAIRCYEKSSETLPNLDTARWLASLYLSQNDFESWERTWTEFLKTEDENLSHALAHEALARGLAIQGRWKEALSHARTSAEPYPTLGLMVASHITEGLAMWDESEHWIRETSRHYPTFGGYLWYFWCRRTGRGDLESAQKMAQVYFERDNYEQQRNKLVMQGAYRLLDERVGDGLESYKKALAFTPTYTCTFMVAQISRELGDTQTADQVLEAMERHYAELGDKRDSADEVGYEILQVIKSQVASDETIEQIDADLQPIDGPTRSAFAYFLARELEAIGNTEKADEYYRKALTIPNGDAVYSTLAGARLAEKYNTSRKVDDVLDEINLWPRPSERDADDKNEEATSGAPRE